MNGSVRHGAIAGDLAGLRILAIMPSIPVQGMERSNLQIMKMMRARGADVLFVTERTYGQRVQREVERIGCRWTSASFAQRLHLSRDPREMAAVAAAWIHAAREVVRIHRHYTPTHTYVTDLATVLYALPVLHRAREPVIFRLPNPPSTRLRAIKARISELIWRRCVERVCDVLVCNSEYSRTQIARLGIDTRNVPVIYNCVAERSEVEPGDAPLLDTGRFNVVFLGRIRPEKGVEELFEAACRIAREREDVDFHLVGEHRWRNPFAAELIDRIRAKGLERRIRVMGPIDDVFGLLAQSDLHVCPSRSAEESFPNVILEAKMHALPSVVFPSAGLPEAVRHLVDGYVCRATSAAALYIGIQYFLDDPAALRTAGDEAKRSLEQFSAARAADAWATLFRTAAKR